MIPGRRQLQLPVEKTKRTADMLSRRIMGISIWLRLNRYQLLEAEAISSKSNRKKARPIVSKVLRWPTLIKSRNRRKDR